MLLLSCSFQCSNISEIHFCNSFKKFHFETWLLIVSLPNSLNISPCIICFQQMGWRYMSSFHRKLDTLHNKNAELQHGILHLFTMRYFPTLALSKSGCGLKHSLTLSPPARAPHVINSFRFNFFTGTSAILIAFGWGWCYIIDSFWINY